MNNRGKVMILAALCLLVILVVKSLWIDPVGELEGDYQKYKNYALEAAPLKDVPFNINLPIVNYKVVSVKKISDEGATTIFYNEGGKIIEEELKGEYVARVRAYFFSILPFTDFQIKGGQDNGNKL